MPVKLTTHVTEISGDTGLKSWQVALLIGTPVAIGAAAGFWFYSKQSQKVNKVSNMSTRKNKAPVKVVPKREMTEEEKNLMKAINESNFEELQTIIRTTNDLKLNFVDENGMSPLQAACYKGNLDMVQFLIERGSNVNDNQHVHGYTALMFASLGGHLAIVSLLLDSGADVTATNTVGRTAAAMAAFVGQHKVVATINNFIPRCTIESFAKKGSKSSSSSLIPLSLVDPILILARTINVHPVKIIFHVINNKGLLDQGSKVIQVLNCLRDQEMSKDDPNESLALKFHFLTFFIQEIMKEDQKIKEQDKKDDGDKKQVADDGDNKKQDQDGDKTRFDGLIKKWIKGRDEDGFPLNLEIMLRSSIREFPFQDSVLFVQLVRTLSATQLGHEPSAVSILFQSVNGQKGFDDTAAICSTCCEPFPPKRCSQCQSVSYCDYRCQKLHWFTHKKFCHKLKHNFEEEQKLNQKMKEAKIDDTSSKVTNSGSEVTNPGFEMSKVTEIETANGHTSEVTN